MRSARDMVPLLDFGDFHIFLRSAASYLSGGDMFLSGRQTVTVHGRTVTLERPNLNPPTFTCCCP